MTFFEETVTAITSSPTSRSAVDGFLFALANGLHCAGMCGPLASWAAGGTAVGATAWQGGRLVAYTAAGAALGGVGAGLGAGVGAATGGAGAPAAGGLTDGVTSGWISVGLAVVLVAFALGLESRIGNLPIPGLRGLVTGGTRRVQGLPPTLRAGALGALTAFLPCGLLWAILAAAAATGSIALGSATMVGFALGSLVPVFFVQGNIAWLRAHLGPRGLQRTARGLMLLTAALFAWRGLMPLLSEDGTAACCTH